MQFSKQLNNYVIDTPFVGSCGWLHNFMARYSISLRRRTTVSQKLPGDVDSQIVEYLMKVRRLRRINSYPSKCIIAMDEVALWLDMPADTTLDIKGTRSIPIKTTGHEKHRFTVCLAACADGRKIWPFILFKGKRPVKALQGVTGVYVGYSDNGWMNETTTITWLKSCCAGTFENRRLLCWDTFKAHGTQAVKDQANSKRIDIAFVPGGCTGIIQVRRYCIAFLSLYVKQAADVCWNKTFKQKYQDLYDDWQRDGRKSFTKGGSQRAPTKPQVVQWVELAWNSLPTDLIVDSFQSCGITVATDGSKDDEIHCMKSGQPAEGAKELLRTKTRKLLRDERDDDPFTDSENESEDESESSSSSDELSFASSDEGELYRRDVEQEGSAGFPITL